MELADILMLIRRGDDDKTNTVRADGLGARLNESSPRLPNPLLPRLPLLASLMTSSAV